MGKKTVYLLGLVAACFLFNPIQAHAGERFTDNGDGTVTDHQLGVLWGRTDNLGDVDWKDAERWVKYTFPFSLPMNKRDNWRLPTIMELRALYITARDYRGYDTDCGQWVKIVSQIKLSCGWTWSSEKIGITARVFSFQSGYHYTDRMVHKRGYRALAVRTLEPSELGD